MKHEHCRDPEHERRRDLEHSTAEIWNIYHCRDPEHEHRRDMEHEHCRDLEHEHGRDLEHKYSIVANRIMHSQIMHLASGLARLAWCTEKAAGVYGKGGPVRKT